MLNLHRIERQFHAGEYDRLLRHVFDNGLRLPLPLRVRLSQSRAATLALVLRRVVEMTYGPTPLSRAMTDALLAEQSEGGAFLADDRPDPLATATAVAALTLVRQEQPTVADPAVESAYDRGLAALSEMQEVDGLFRAADDRSDVDRARTAAFVLWLLAAEPAFTERLHMGDLCNWFDVRLARLEPTTVELYELARLSQTTEPPRTPAVAALAA